MNKVEEEGSIFFESRRSVQKLNALVFGRDARLQPEDSPGAEARCNVKQIFVKLVETVCRNADVEVGSGGGLENAVLSTFP
jgi:hypothetical protein